MNLSMRSFRKSVHSFKESAEAFLNFDDQEDAVLHTHEEMAQAVAHASESSSFWKCAFRP
jgi:hypothetical protein